MTTYKGNAGNLMQHWTLCEIVNIADEENVPGLSFIDAHAMAPCAEDPDANPGHSGPLFSNARAALPGQRSVYERAWHQLAPVEGYPNSANFVQHVWTRDFSMLLCEKDSATVTALDTWLPLVQRHPKCKRAKVFPGDWRDRFATGLPNPFQVGLSDGALTLVSFDPNMYDRHGPPQEPKPENMYPRDLRVAVGSVRDVKGGVLIQLSTYSAQNNNSQLDALASIDSIFTRGGFGLAAQVVFDGNMMSLVYARNISWSAELAELPRRFGQWRPN